MGDTDRLTALEHSGLLDTVDAILRRYTEIAAAALNVPMVAVLLVTSSRQVLKGAIGFGDITETSLQASTCALAVRSGEPVIVSNTRTDPRTRDLESVPGLRSGAYAGFPIRSPAGVLGTLCVLDSSPREWTDSEMAILEQIAEAARTAILYYLDKQLRLRAENWARTQTRLLTAAIEGHALADLTPGFTQALADHFPSSSVLVALTDPETGEIQSVSVSGLLRLVELLPIGGLADTPARGCAKAEPFVSSDLATDWGGVAAIAMQAGLTGSVTLTVVGGDGHMLGTLTVFHNDQVAAAMGADLTELKRGVDLLRTLLQSARGRVKLAQSEERLSLALSSTKVGIFDWRVPADRLILDAHWNKLIGEVAPITSAVEFAARVHPDDGRRTQAHLDRVLSGEEEEYDSEYRVLNAKGESVWIRSRGRIVERGPNGEPLRMTGTFADVSKRKAQEFELERLSAAIANLNDAVLITDPATDIDDTPMIRFANPAIAHVLGLQPADIIGRSIASLIGRTPRHLGLLQDARRELLEGRTAQFMLDIIDSNGKTIWLEAMVQPIRDASVSKGFWVTVAREVTARVQAERELAESREQLRHAQKMEAVGRLAGGMAHDFNNLLTAILGYGEFISEEAPPGSSLRQDADEIVGAASRGQAITKQLLAFSRKNTWNPSSFGLDEALASVERLIEKIIGEDVHLTVLPATLSGNVMTDRNQLEQAVINLAINARDALTRGGTVTLSTDSVVLDRVMDAMPEPVAPGDYEVILVHDDGTGIPPEVIQHIFEPFFTTKETGKGTGLGLATAYGTVKQSDGFITVDSEVDVGTTFRIFLPKSGVVTEARRPVQILAEPEFHGSETVLVVEDEVQVRNLVVRMLRHVGYQVYEAKHGADALLIWEEHRSEIDLVVTDVVMPVMNGTELAQALREADPTLPILFMSGYTGGSTGGRELSTRIPAAELLPKPFTTPDLLLRVRARLDGRINLA